MNRIWQLLRALAYIGVGVWALTEGPLPLTALGAFLILCGVICVWGNGALVMDDEYKRKLGPMIETMKKHGYMR